MKTNKPITLRVNQEIQKKAKIYAAEHGKTISFLYEEAITEYMQIHQSGQYSNPVS